VLERSYADTVDFRGLELDVEGLRNSKCENCGYVWTTDAQDGLNQAVLKAAFVTERDRLRLKYGLLTGSQIAEVRARLGLNQREAAAVFGGGHNAFNKYESGEVLQSFAMDRLLRLSDVVGAFAVEFLRDVHSSPRFRVVRTLSSAERNAFVLSVVPSGVGERWVAQAGASQYSSEVHEHAPPPSLPQLAGVTIAAYVGNA